MKYKIRTYTFGANIYLNNPEKWNRYLYEHKIWGTNGNRNIALLNEYMTTDKTLDEVAIRYGLQKARAREIIIRFLRLIERNPEAI